MLGPWGSYIAEMELVLSMGIVVLSVINGDVVVQDGRFKIIDLQVWLAFQAVCWKLWGQFGSVLSIGFVALSVINGEVVVQDGRFKSIDLPVLLAIKLCAGRWGGQSERWDRCLALVPDT